jgi:TonB-linked SusC/RagA family outer membrane protein
MRSTLQQLRSVRSRWLGFGRVACLSAVFALVLGGPLSAQQVEVTGRVSAAATGQPLANVMVMVRGSDTRTVTDAQGRYTISVASDGVLVYSLIGYRAVALDVAGRSSLDVLLEQAVAVLGGVVVTGYAEQRRADITGAVASIDMESLQKESSSSVLQRLDGKVSGVTVERSGTPGARSTVRIRGISSFQNNDPLYIVDGTPIEGTYFNWLNPNDIESIQVLKDASAASIYGSRASNGVVIIETRKQGTRERPRFTLDVRTGMQQPYRGYDDILILNSLEYHEVVKRSYENAGLAVPANIYGDPNSPSVPAYIWPNDGVNPATGVVEDDYNFPDNLIMAGSNGTNWWDAVFGTGYTADVNLGVRGSGDSHGYNVSLNYYDNDGAAAYSRFQRGSARVNTQFNLGKLRIGENISMAYERFVGGLGDCGGGTACENTIVGKNILMQPVVPVYDVGGNFASGKAPTLGNQSNPLKVAWADKDDVGKNLILFGNVFAGFDFTEELKFTSRLGFNLVEYHQVFYDPIDPENSEPSLSTALDENYSTTRDWTWSNVLNYTRTFGDGHNIAMLLGQEATRQTNRNIGAGFNSLLSPDIIDSRYIQDALGDAATKRAGSGGSISSLLSYFGKVDYNYDNRYYLSFTIRRDGSSRLGPDNRWGTFPAFNLGWRLSQEGFLRNNEFFTNVMVRAGYGVTGNQLIPAGRIVSQFTGAQCCSFYDITGSGNSIVAGYFQDVLGNPNLKWEQNKSLNVGVDLEFFSGDVSLALDWYQRTTSDLLFDPQQPAPAGTVAPPILNVGEMKNTGLDMSLNFQGALGNTGTWSVGLNASHYKNEIVKIDGEQDFFFGPSATRFGNQTINRVGEPLGSFYGYETNGFFEDDAAVAAHATQNGAAPGRIRFVDQLTVDSDGDGIADQTDGVINEDDRTLIGSPHPDFTMGLDIAVEVGAFDFSATFFGTFGNEIFDTQKEYYVFRNFSTNVRKDLLTDSWELGADNTNAKYPRLDVNDTFSGQQLSDFYVESGTYIRLRSLQVGYTLPESFIPGTRIYIQGENLLTLTGYSGLDPALPTASLFGSGGDIRDQYRGIDRGVYPTNRMISFGINTSF